MSKKKVTKKKVIIKKIDWNTIEEEIKEKGDLQGADKLQTIENISTKYKVSKGEIRELVNHLENIRTKEKKSFDKSEKERLKTIPVSATLKEKILTYIISKQYSKASEELVKEVRKNNHIYTTDDDIKPEIWIYQDGIYIPNGKNYIKESLRKILQTNYTTFLANEVIAKIMADTFIKQEDFFKNENVVELPVQNGILNVLTLELSEFTHEKIFFSKIPVKYDYEKKCPNIDKFLMDIVKHPSDIKVIEEIAGYGLYKDHPIEKAAMFVGSGRNGKGKLIQLFEKLVGKINCCSVPLEQMHTNSTAVCELFGCLLNLAGDLNNRALKDLGMFKAITGRDLIAAKRKFMRDLFFISHAKNIFACNELPRVFDLSKGFWSRWVLLEFPYEFVTKKEYDETSEKEFKKIRDPFILDNITTEEEMSGFLNKALIGLKRVLALKDFSKTKGSEEVKDLWVKKSSSFTAFCMNSLEENPDEFITKKNLRQLYHKFCKKNRLKGAGDKEIKVTLEDMFGVVEGRKDIEGNMVYIWEGIEIKKEEAKEEIEEREGKSEDDDVS